MQQLQQEENQVVRILSLDGGGIRGFSVARILAEIEKFTNQKICELFDVVVGTSTGGLIAGMVSIPHRKFQRTMTAQEIMNLYYDEGNNIFNKKTTGFFSSKYTTEGLEQVINSGYEKSVTLKNAIIPCGMMCSIKNNYRQSLLLNSMMAQKGDWLHNVPLEKSMLATSAAPSFFPSVHINNTKIENEPFYIDSFSETRFNQSEIILEDGGTSANNPVKWGIDYALAFLKEKHYDMNRVKLQMVSISTGDYQDIEEIKGNKGGIGFINEMLNDPLDIIKKIELNHLEAKKFFGDREGGDSDYHRITFDIDKTMEFDITNKKYYSKLLKIAEDYLYEDKAKGIYKPHFRHVLAMLSKTYRRPAFMEEDISRPIPLLDFNPTTERFFLSLDAKKQLSQLDGDCFVVSVTGLQGVGKSLYLNMLISLFQANYDALKPPFQPIKFIEKFKVQRKTSIDTEPENQTKELDLLFMRLGTKNLILIDVEGGDEVKSSLKSWISNFLMATVTKASHISLHIFEKEIDESYLKFFDWISELLLAGKQEFTTSSDLYFIAKDFKYDLTLTKRSSDVIETFEKMQLKKKHLEMPPLPETFGRTLSIEFQKSSFFRNFLILYKKVQKLFLQPPKYTSGRDLAKTLGDFVELYQEQYPLIADTVYYKQRRIQKLEENRLRIFDHLDHIHQNHVTSVNMEVLLENIKKMASKDGFDELLKQFRNLDILLPKLEYLKREIKSLVRDKLLDEKFIVDNEEEKELIMKSELLIFEKKWKMLTMFIEECSSLAEKYIKLDEDKKTLVQQISDFFDKKEKSPSPNDGTAKSRSRSGSADTGEIELLDLPKSEKFTFEEEEKVDRFLELQNKISEVLDKKIKKEKIGNKDVKTLLDLMEYFNAQKAMKKLKVKLNIQ